MGSSPTSSIDQSDCLEVFLPFGAVLRDVVRLRWRWERGVQASGALQASSQVFGAFQSARFSGRLAEFTCLRSSSLVTFTLARLQAIFLSLQARLLFFFSLHARLLFSCRCLFSLLLLMVLRLRAR